MTNPPATLVLGQHLDFDQLGLDRQHSIRGAHELKMHIARDVARDAVDHGEMRNDVSVRAPIGDTTRERVDQPHRQVAKQRHRLWSQPAHSPEHRDVAEPKPLARHADQTPGRTHANGTGPFVITDKRCPFA